MIGAVEVGSGITSTEFDHMKRNNSRGLVPVGSLEQHGPHLPVATDLIIAEYVTKHIAKRIGSFVFPPIYYGISGEHSPFFNVSLRYSTFIDTIHDIVCLSLRNRPKKSYFCKWPSWEHRRNAIRYA